MSYLSIATFSIFSAIVCMKWALELGYSQWRQILWGVLGFCFSLLALFFLYVRHVRRSMQVQNRCSTD
jgi:hypothetical protein